MVDDIESFIRTFDRAQKAEDEGRFRNAADLYTKMAEAGGGNEAIDKIASKGYYRCLMKVYGIKQGGAQNG